MTGRDPLVTIAALSAALAVAAGAFGAHGATGKAAEWLATGATYQMIHTVAAIALAGRPAFRRPGWMLLAGAGLFGVTLYITALGGPRWLGAVTPVGGALMIGGWLWLALGALRR